MANTALSTAPAEKPLSPLEQQLDQLRLEVLDLSRVVEILDEKLAKVRYIPPPQDEAKADEDKMPGMSEYEWALNVQTTLIRSKTAHLRYIIDTLRV